MSTVASSVRHRVDLRPVTALVALGDLACIGAFVLLGEISHGIDPVANPGHVAGTYAPFLLGWLAVSIPAGVYAAGARTERVRGVARTAVAWVGAALLAQAIRATSLFHGGAAVTFFLVSCAVGLALLVPYRAIVATLLAE